MAGLEHFHEVSLSIRIFTATQVVLGRDFVVFAYFVTHEEGICVYLIAFI